MRVPLATIAVLPDVCGVRGARDFGGDLARLGMSLGSADGKEELDGVPEGAAVGADDPDGDGLGKRKCSP